MTCRFATALLALALATPVLAHDDIAAHVHDSAGGAVHLGPDAGGVVALLTMVLLAGLAAWRLRRDG
jgi:hypothetical protein